MREQRQTIFGLPFDNCFSTAVACIFDVAVEDMQNFMFSGDNEWWEVCVSWCGERGYTPLMFPLPTFEDLRNLPNSFCVVSGPAARGLDHAVVYRGEEMMWDPHPSDLGISSPNDVTVFVKNNPGDPTFDLLKAITTKESDDVSALRLSRPAVSDGYDPCHGSCVASAEALREAAEAAQARRIRNFGTPTYRDLGSMKMLPPADRSWEVSMVRCGHDNDPGDKVCSECGCQLWSKEDYIDEHSVVTEEKMELVKGILDMDGLPFKRKVFVKSDDLQRKGLDHWYPEAVSLGCGAPMPSKCEVCGEDWDGHSKTACGPGVPFRVIPDDSEEDEDG